MKLVMKADDGKEIVYLSSDDYDVGTVSTYPDDLFIMINNLSIEKKEYLDKLFESEEKSFTSYPRDNNFVLETPSFYFLFANNVNDSIIKITENNENDAIVRIGFTSPEDENITIAIRIGKIYVNK